MARVKLGARLDRLESQLARLKRAVGDLALALDRASPISLRAAGTNIAQVSSDLVWRTSPSSRGRPPDSSWLPGSTPWAPAPVRCRVPGDPDHLRRARRGGCSPVPGEWSVCALHPGCPDGIPVRRGHRLYLAGRRSGRLPIWGLQGLLRDGGLRAGPAPAGSPGGCESHRHPVRRAPPVAVPSPVHRECPSAPGVGGGPHRGTGPDLGSCRGAGGIAHALPPSPVPPNPAGPPLHRTRRRRATPATSPHPRWRDP